jgi:hypothetical protein
MAERILGPQGSKRRRRFLWVPMLVVAALALFVIGGAQSSVGIAQSVFELDASQDLGAGAAPKAAITDNATTATPDDWDRVCHTATSGSQCASAANDHALARSFDSETNADGTANNATIFTGGGSKDPSPLSGWSWKDASGGLPDKDNLLHGMAARYLDGTDSEIFFGADRFDNSGDSQIGFWFFKTAVCTKADGSFGTGTQANCSGTATHTAGLVPHSTTQTGDILILSDFTNGGAQPTIRVFEYVGSGGSDGSLNLLGGNATDVRDCKNVSTPDFCAAVNNIDGAQAPWLFENKSGQTTYGHGEFYEGGLNLNYLGLQNDCFSSFLAETRSSQSPTATLKDFVLGGFQQCGAGLATTASGDGQAVGANGTASISDAATITVNGGTTPPAPSGTTSVSFYLCSSQTQISSCTASANTLKTTKLVSTATHQAGTNDYVVQSGSFSVGAGYYCWTATWPGDSNYQPTGGATVFQDNGQGECLHVLPLQPALHTAVSVNPTNVTPGTSVHDTVTFDTPPATPSNGTFGTVAFKLYYSASGPITACNASGVTSSAAGSTTIDATHTSYDSNTVSPTAPGYYAFTVSYTHGSGDANNLDVAETSCTATGEQFRVLQFNPTMTTAQTVVISDSATVQDGGGGGALAGTVHFRAYSDSGCSAGHELTADQARSVSGNAPQTVSTTTSVTLTATGTVYWKVSYDSTNPAQTSIAATCTENTSTTINN